MNVTIGFPIPAKEHENRRALIPADIKHIKNPDKLIFEEDYGHVLGYTDRDYRNTGAKIAPKTDVANCPLICNPKPMLTDNYFGQSKCLFGWIHAVQGRSITDKLLEHKMTAIAWEEMFEQQRHSFWRNNEISGEAAVCHAFMFWGTLPYESRVAVIGRGNVARGAIRMLERFGCRVKVYDRKTSPLIRKEIDHYDVIVNAVLWDVFRDDHIIYKEDLAKMKPGSLIIDISCDEAMGIESSRATTIEEPTYTCEGIVHYAVDHTPALFYKSATESISAVVSRFLDDLIEVNENLTLTHATIIKDGYILDDKITRFQGR